MLTQIFSLIMLNARHLPQRLSSSLVAVVGAAGVVGVLIAVLSMAVGFEKTMETAGDPSHAIVLRGGANTELSSFISRESVEIMEAAPGVLKRDGKSFVAPQLTVVLDLPKQDTGTSANVPLRGVTPVIYEFLPNFEMVEGRLPQAGTREVISGVAALREFSGLQTGNTIGEGNNTWRVVGLFRDGGSVRESEVWADATAVQETFRRGSSYNSVLAALETPAALQLFKDALEADPRMDVKVQRETDYYFTQSEALRTFITILGYSVAVIMAIGAVFAALNTMYSAVSARAREIGTLRALGFGSIPVVIAVLAEAMLLTVIGGILGAAAAWLLFNGFQVSTLNFTSFSQVAFAFNVSWELIFKGVIWAMFIGFLGGLFPALRAARIPVVEALRAE